MNSERIIGLVVHALACVLYIVMNNYAVPVYKQLVGGLTSRGVAIGMGMYFIFYFFVFLNFVLVFIRRLAIKFGVAIFMMLSILFYMLPQYPVRGMAYCALAGGLTVCAILLTRVLDAAFTRWRAARGSGQVLIRNRRFTSPLVLIPALMGLFVLVVFLGMKIVSSLTAKPLDKDWSESGKCYVVRYAPGYKAWGAVGRMIELYSSPYFYRVYTKDDVLLKSSEWYLWMREGNASVAPEFLGETVLYPGTQGWESWTVAECR